MYLTSILFCVTILLCTVIFCGIAILLGYNSTNKLNDLETTKDVTNDSAMTEKDVDQAQIKIDSGTPVYSTEKTADPNLEDQAQKDSAAKHDSTHFFDMAKHICSDPYINECAGEDQHIDFSFSNRTTNIDSSQPNINCHEANQATKTIKKPKDAADKPKIWKYQKKTSKNRRKTNAKTVGDNLAVQDVNENGKQLLGHDKNSIQNNSGKEAVQENQKFLQQEPANDTKNNMNEDTVKGMTVKNHQSEELDTIQNSNMQIQHTDNLTSAKTKPNHFNALNTDDYNTYMDIFKEVTSIEVRLDGDLMSIVHKLPFRIVYETSENIEKRINDYVYKVYNSVNNIFRTKHTKIDFETFEKENEDQIMRFYAYFRIFLAIVTKTKAIESEYILSSEEKLAVNNILYQYVTPDTELIYGYIYETEIVETYGPSFVKYVLTNSVAVIDIKYNDDEEIREFEGMVDVYLNIYRQRVCTKTVEDQFCAYKTLLKSINIDIKWGGQHEYIFNRKVNNIREEIACKEYIHMALE